MRLPGYRALELFWAAVLALLAGGVATLSWLGPLPEAPAADAPLAVLEAPAPMPAAASPPAPIAAPAAPAAREPAAIAALICLRLPTGCSTPSALAACRAGALI